MNVRQAAKARDELTDWQAGIGLMLKKIKTSEEARQDLNAHLRTFIKYIKIFGRGTDEKAEELIEHVVGVIRETKGKPSEEEWEFVRWLKAKARGVDGVFARIYWKLPSREPEEKSRKQSKSKRPRGKIQVSNTLDVMPEGSILPHMVRRDGHNEHVTPELDKLWRRWKKFTGEKRRKAQKRKSSTT